MIHLRIVSPPDVTEQVMDVLTRDSVINVIRLDGAAPRRPVALEAACGDRACRDVGLDGAARTFEGRILRERAGLHFDESAAHGAAVAETRPVPRELAAREGDLARGVRGLATGPTRD